MQGTYWLFGTNNNKKATLRVYNYGEINVNGGTSSTKAVLSVGNYGVIKNSAGSEVVTSDLNVKNSISPFS
jgi:hypothetical protein